MSLQHQRISELCEQLKLARLGVQWPALAQDAARDEANLFFNVVAKRYERASMVLTSNLPFTQWGGAFADDQTLTATMLDRLCTRAHRADQRRELPPEGQTQGWPSSKEDRAGAVIGEPRCSAATGYALRARAAQSMKSGWVRFTSAITQESGSELNRR